MIIDDRRLIPTENNLTLTRLLLASAVIWTHSIWRVTGVGDRDQVSAWLGIPVSAIAVDGFFFLSGMLVYSSLLRRSVGDFALARLARLWPGLAVAVTVIVAGGWFLTLAPGLSYFGGATARFVGGNLSLAGGGYYLTGVECAGRPCNVNGSLWTITWEARCYLVLALLSLTGLAAPGRMKRLVLPLSLAFAVLMHVPMVRDAMAAGAGRGALYLLDQWDRLWSMFALGIAAHLWRERIHLSWAACLVLLAMVLVSHRWLPVPHLAGLFTGYAVLCLGFLSARRSAVSGRWPDYSYGIYIYAFPVMMVVAALLPTESYLLLALATWAATLPLAASSWHLVEKPALELVKSRRLRGRQQARAATDDGDVAIDVVAGVAADAKTAVRQGRP